MNNDNDNNDNNYVAIPTRQIGSVNPVYDKLRRVCENITEVDLRIWQIIQDDDKIVSVLAQLHPHVDVTVSHWLLGDTITMVNVRVGKNNTEWRIDNMTWYDNIDKFIAAAKNNTDNTGPVRLFYGN